eukprot:5985561-Prymnesium_polylepis.1
MIQETLSRYIEASAQAETIQKKLRTVSKKLRQIEGLHAPADRSLTAEEQHKLEQEGKLRSQFAELQAQLAELSPTEVQAQPEAEETLSHYLSHEDTQPELMCRICFCEDSRDKLIAPCACKGSIELVHADCLREWITRTINSESRSVCSQCKQPYMVRRGVRAKRRLLLRQALTVVAFFALSLFAAAFLPWYARCCMGSKWQTWRKDRLFMIPPGLIDEIEQLNWHWDTQLDYHCERNGPWHTTAALVYGSVKISGLGLNVCTGNMLLAWLRDGELAPPVVFLGRKLDRFGFDVGAYASFINGAITVAWYGCVSPYFWGYMPNETTNLAIWLLVEVVGAICVIERLAQGLEDVELWLMERSGGLPAADLLICDIKRGSYH